MMTGLVIVLPLFQWNELFTHNTLKYASTFYVFELVLVLTIYILVALRLNLKVAPETNKTWVDFYKKVAFILKYIWPSKSLKLQIHLIICMFTLFAARFINVALPLYTKWIVDELSGPKRFCYDLILIATGLNYLRGNGAMGGFMNTLRAYFWIRVEQNTTREVQLALFEHLHNLSLKWHISRKTGQIFRIMDRGTSSIITVFTSILFNIAPTIIDIFVASVFFFVTFEWYFGVLVMFTLTFYIIITIFITQWRTKFRRLMNELDNFARAIGMDSLLNYETVKHYNAEQLEKKRYDDAMRKAQDAEYTATVSLSILNFTQNSIIGISTVVGSLLVAFLISKHNSHLTAGDYVLFTTYMLQLYGPLNFFGTVYRTIQTAFIDMENMFDLLKEETETVDDIDSIELPKEQGSIVFDNVTFGYNQQRKILENVSFTVHPGETIAIVGPSGSGKTTVVRLLFRLYDVDEGSISFAGYDIRKLKRKSLRQSIGIVPQDTVLFNDTIGYNIQYGRPSASQEEIEDAAKAAAIHDFIVSHSEAYKVLVGERGLKLSGGEKQRVAIARTILKQPQYILLDEATSALDSQTERAIQENLYELCRSRTSVIVAHRLSTIVHADRILVLKHGRIVESGTHDELLSLNGLYYDMWELQNKPNRQGSEKSLDQTAIDMPED
uniref:ATP-binding cassette sub-family B member 6, mitochondrial n=1 Tax=Acrobeloides nanus TaxID=290746 RepID=A0A914D2Y3_9BILA